MQRLLNAPTQTGTSPFYNVPVTAGAAGNDYVQFSSEDGNISCKMDIIPVDGGVSVAASCGEELAADPTEESDAISGTTRELWQVGLTEFVDSALEGRPFNKATVTAGTVSTVMSNLPAMQKQALETQRKMQELEQEIEGGEYYGGYPEDDAVSDAEFYAE